MQQRGSEWQEDRVPDHVTDKTCVRRYRFERPHQRTTVHYFVKEITMMVWLRCGYNGRVWETFNRRVGKWRPLIARVHSRYNTMLCSLTLIATPHSATSRGSAHMHSVHTYHSICSVVDFL